MKIIQQRNCHTPKTLVLLVTSLLYQSKMGYSRSAVQPTIMDNPDKVTHNEGDVAVLYCSVLNLGDSTVTWRKMSSSSPLTIGTRSWVRDMRVHAEHVPYSSHWNLVIEQVRAEDAGEYECQVNKRKSQLRQRVTLLVKGIEINGHVLQLTCDAILVDMAVDAVTWTKDGISLPKSNDDRCRVHTSLTMNGQNVGVVVSTLEVRDTRHDDSGVYVCRTSEKAQMAGVKVDIQGTHHLKRDDVKMTSLSNRRSTELDQSVYNKTTSYFNPVATNLLSYMCVLLTRHLVYYFGLIT